MLKYWSHPGYNELRWSFHYNDMVLLRLPRSSSSVLGKYSDLYSMSIPLVSTWSWIIKLKWPDYQIISAQTTTSQLLATLPQTLMTLKPTSELKLSSSISRNLALFFLFFLFFDFLSSSIPGWTMMMVGDTTLETPATSFTQGWIFYLKIQKPRKLTCR